MSFEQRSGRDASERDTITDDFDRNQEIEQQDSDKNQSSVELEEEQDFRSHPSSPSGQQISDNRSSSPHSSSSRNRQGGSQYYKDDIGPGELDEEDNQTGSGQSKSLDDLYERQEQGTLSEKDIIDRIQQKDRSDQANGANGSDVVDELVDRDHEGGNFTFDSTSLVRKADHGDRSQEIDPRSEGKFVEELGDDNKSHFGSSPRFSFDDSTPESGDRGWDLPSGNTGSGGMYLKFQQNPPQVYQHKSSSFQDILGNFKQLVEINDNLGLAAVTTDLSRLGIELNDQEISLPIGINLRPESMQYLSRSPNPALTERQPGELPSQPDNQNQEIYFDEIPDQQTGTDLRSSPAQSERADNQQSPPNSPKPKPIARPRSNRAQYLVDKSENPGRSDRSDQPDGPDQSEQSSGSGGLFNAQENTDNSDSTAEEAEDGSTEESSEEEDEERKEKSRSSHRTPGKSTTRNRVAYSGKAGSRYYHEYQYWIGNTDQSNSPVSQPVFRPVSSPVRSPIEDPVEHPVETPVESPLKEFEFDAPQVREVWYEVPERKRRRFLVQMDYELWSLLTSKGRRNPVGYGGGQAGYSEGYFGQNNLYESFEESHSRGFQGVNFEYRSGDISPSNPSGLSNPAGQHLREQQFTSQSSFQGVGDISPELRYRPGSSSFLAHAEEILQRPWLTPLVPSPALERRIREVIYWYLTNRFNLGPYRYQYRDAGKRSKEKFFQAAKDTTEEESDVSEQSTSKSEQNEPISDNTADQTYSPSGYTGPYHLDPSLIYLLKVIRESPHQILKNFIENLIRQANAGYIPNWKLGRIETISEFLSKFTNISAISDFVASLQTRISRSPNPELQSVLLPKIFPAYSLLLKIDRRWKQIAVVFDEAKNGVDQAQFAQREDWQNLYSVLPFSRNAYADQALFKVLKQINPGLTMAEFFDLRYYSNGETKFDPNQPHKWPDWVQNHYSKYGKAMAKTLKIDMFVEFRVILTDNMRDLFDSIGESEITGDFIERMDELETLVRNSKETDLYTVVNSPTLIGDIGEYMGIMQQLTRTRNQLIEKIQNNTEYRFKRSEEILDEANNILRKSVAFQSNRYGFDALIAIKQSLYNSSLDSWDVTLYEAKFRNDADQFDLNTKSRSKGILQNDADFIIKFQSIQHRLLEIFSKYEIKTLDETKEILRIFDHQIRKEMTIARLLLEKERDIYFEFREKFGKIEITAPGVGKFIEYVTSGTLPDPNKLYLPNIVKDGRFDKNLLSEVLIHPEIIDGSSPVLLNPDDDPVTLSDREDKANDNVISQTSFSRKVIVNKTDNSLNFDPTVRNPEIKHKTEVVLNFVRLDITNSEFQKLKSSNVLKSNTIYVRSNSNEYSSDKFKEITNQILQKDIDGYFVIENGGRKIRLSADYNKSVAFLVNLLSENYRSPINKVTGVISTISQVNFQQDFIHAYGDDALLSSLDELMFIFVKKPDVHPSLIAFQKMMSRELTNQFRNLGLDEDLISLVRQRIDTDCANGDIGELYKNTIGDELVKRLDIVDQAIGEIFDCPMRGVRFPKASQGNPDAPDGILVSKSEVVSGSLTLESKRFGNYKQHLYIDLNSNLIYLKSVIENSTENIISYRPIELFKETDYGPKLNSDVFFNPSRQKDSHKFSKWALKKNIPFASFKIAPNRIRIQFLKETGYLFRNPDTNAVKMGKFYLFNLRDIIQKQIDALSNLDPVIFGKIASLVSNDAGFTIRQKMFVNTIESLRKFGKDLKINISNFKNLNQLLTYHIDNLMVTWGQNASKAVQDITVLDSAQMSMHMNFIIYRLIGAHLEYNFKGLDRITQQPFQYADSIFSEFYDVQDADHNKSIVVIFDEDLGIQNNPLELIDLENLSDESTTHMKNLTESVFTSIFRLGRDARNLDGANISDILISDKALLTHLQSIYGPVDPSRIYSLFVDEMELLWREWNKHGAETYDKRGRRARDRDTYTFLVTSTDGTSEPKKLGHYFRMKGMGDKSKREIIDHKITQYFNTLRNLLTADLNDVVSFTKLIKYLTR